MLADSDNDETSDNEPHCLWTAKKPIRRCQEDDQVPDSLSEPISTSSDPQGDMRDMVQWGKRPTYDMMVDCLESPTTLLPPDGSCASLVAHLHTLTDNYYKRRNRQKTRNLKNRDNVKAEAAKVRHQAKLDLQDASLASLICRLRNSKAMPPLAIMRGLDNMFLGMPKKIWARQSQEGYAASETFIDRALDQIKDWKPMPEFPIYRTISLLIEDNLEFYLKVPEERMIGGVLKKSSLLHTTTSESHNPTPTLPQPYPDPTPTLPRPYPKPTLHATSHDMSCDVPHATICAMRACQTPSAMRLTPLCTGRLCGPDGCQEVPARKRRHCHPVPCHVPLHGQHDISDSGAE